MDSLRTPAAIASLVAANVAPLAGILFLGWSPASVLVLYFVDTFLSLGGVLLLVAAHVTGNDAGKRFAGWKDWAKAVIGLAIFGAIMAFPLAFPLVVVLGEDLGMKTLAHDRGFLIGLGWQILFALHALVRQHRELTLRSDDDRVLAHRALFLIARWVVMFMGTVTGLVGMLGPAIGGFVMVAIYSGASVYFELFPDRAQRLLRGRDAKPIVWQGDLDGKAARDRATHAKNGGGQR